MERRAEERFPARFPLVYGADIPEEAAKVRGNSETADISPSGLRFAIYHPVSEGDRLIVEIYPGKRRKPVKLLAEVRWKSAFNSQVHDEVGTRFLKVGLSQRSWLAHLVKEAGGTC